MARIILLMIILFSWPAFATIEIVSVEGHSNYTTTDNSIRIYGGTAGSCTGGTGVCDSCAEATGLTACNQRMINSGTLLQVTFKVTSDLGGKTGTVIVVDKDGTTVSLVSQSTGAAQNDQVSFQVYWTNLCAKMSAADATCATNSSANFTIGIDTDADNKISDAEGGTVLMQVNNPAVNTIDSCGSSGNTDGVCDMVINPGDSKVVVDNINAEAGFPNTASLSFDRIRLYYSTTNFIDKPSDGEYADLQIEVDDTTFQVANNKVTGLTNDQTYYFRFASVDLAGNVAYFTSNTNISDACGGSPTDLTCQYMATPAEVFGLLSEDLNCFIATAAYGGSWKDKVVDLRAFRNQFLLTNSMGKTFVKLYYSVGPKLARVIAGDSTLRAFTRVLLWPAWAISKIFLAFGSLIGIGFVSLLGIFGLLVTMWSIRKLNHRGVSA